MALYKGKFYGSLKHWEKVWFIRVWRKYGLLVMRKYGSLQR